MITFTTLREEEITLETPEEIRAAIGVVASSFEEWGAPGILLDLVLQVLELPWVKGEEKVALLNLKKGALLMIEGEQIRQRLRIAGEIMLKNLNLKYFEDTVGSHALNEKMKLCNLSNLELYSKSKGD